MYYSLDASDDDVPVKLLHLETPFILFNWTLWASLIIFFVEHTFGRSNYIIKVAKKWQKYRKSRKRARNTFFCLFCLFLCKIITILSGHEAPIVPGLLPIVCVSYIRMQ